MKKDKDRKLSCLSCKLYKHAKTHKIQPYGNGNKGILVIGEAPGQVEDRKGLPWQGRTGRMLERALAKVEIDLFEDCISVNAVNCRPPDNRKPKPFELDCCREVVVSRVIKEMKPKVILLLGSSAIQSFLAPRWPTDLGGIMKWRGFQIPDMDYKCFVVPTFHPSYIARMDSREAYTVWLHDLKVAADSVDLEFPSFPKADIRIIDDLEILDQFTDLSEMAFDYETTGLKPQGKGHRIVSASIAINESLTYSFLMPETKKERAPFINLLTNVNIGKLAHNMKFELNWSEIRLRTTVKNWQWDSMIAAHMIDNRTGTNGLKFQTYRNFGIVDYSSEVLPYLRANANDGNGFNTIDKLLETEEGKRKLLTYGGYDSHYEYLLAKKQMEILGYSFLPF